MKTVIASDNFTGPGLNLRGRWKKHPKTQIGAGVPRGQEPRPARTINCSNIESGERRAL